MDDMVRDDVVGIELGFSRKPMDEDMRDLEESELDDEIEVSDDIDEKL